MKIKILSVIGICLLALASTQTALAAEWQWSVTIDSVASPETHDHPRAFLWIPPNCRRVRGVVVGQHNMEEEMIFEHPKFRATLEELGFAEIWVTPPLDLFFRFDQGAGEHFDEMMKALAAESGYSELSTTPIVPIGHSAAASYPWNFGAWAPWRTLAVLSISGQWPYYKDANTPGWDGLTVDGIPGLVTIGEYENAYDRAGEGLKERAEHPLSPLSMLAEPAGEHFSASDAKISFICLYLRKAAQYRLPADWPLNQPPVLKPIDPTKTGWLVDRWRYDGKPTAPAAPVGEYTGNANNAFWVFDGELAKEVETFGAMYAGKKLELLGYVQKDGVVAQIPKRHVRVALKFEPEADGITFRLSGTFLDTVPYDWRGLKEGDAITHAQDTSKISIDRICGPVARIGPETFAIRENRVGMDNPKRSTSICLMLSDSGDETHRPMMLESELKFPLVNKDGQDQEIKFSLPQNVPLGTVLLPLSANSSADMPVYFYVREGPAYVEGKTIRFTPIPPRAKFPVKVTVVAWQWGRSIDPRVKTATPVEQTISITK